MKQAFIAGLIGALVGGCISVLVGYFAPLPTTSLAAAIGSGAAGFFSGFFGGFMAIATQGRPRHDGASSVARPHAAGRRGDEA